jgi:threonine dehydrogenase-like Zn-dependent dehydrogenase
VELAQGEGPRPTTVVGTGHAGQLRLQRRLDDGGLTPVSIDATGAGEGLGLALGASTFGGTVIVYSIYPDPETVPALDLIYQRELTVLGSRGSGGRWDRALELLVEGRVDPARLTGDPVALEEAPALFRAVADKEIAEPRPLLIPGTATGSDHGKG